MAVFRPVEGNGTQPVNSVNRGHSIRPGAMVVSDEMSRIDVKGFGQMEVFTHWKVAELEAMVKKAIEDLRKLGMDELVIPWYALQNFAKTNESVFTIKQLVKVLKKDLRESGVVRVSWKDGYLYLMWY